MLKDKKSQKIFCEWLQANKDLLSIKIVFIFDKGQDYQNQKAFS